MNRFDRIQIRARNITPEAVSVTIISALRHTSVELEVGALLTIDAAPHEDSVAALQLTDES